MLLATLIRDAPLKPRFVSAVLAPIAPPNETIPAVPALEVTLLFPLIVLENVMSAPSVDVPPFVVSTTTLPVRPTAPVKATEELTVVNVMPLRVEAPLIPIGPVSLFEVVMFPLIVEDPV